MFFCSATINLHLSTGENKTVEAKVGDNLLDVIIDNDLDISGFGKDFFCYRLIILLIN